MKYTIEFFDASVQQAILAWPAGINASFRRIELRMVEHGATLDCLTRAMCGTIR